MIKYLLLIGMIVLLAGCGLQSTEISPLLESRTPLANALQEQGKYSEALIQWKIILTANPNDEFVKRRIVKLETLISNKIQNLLTIAENASAENKQKIERNTYLQILVLDPNNKTAIAALRRTEWELAMEKADSKTQTIKQYFVESQAEAQRSILLSKFLEKGQRYRQGKKYISLINLADEFELEFPSAEEPQNWRFLAYTKLAEKSVRANNIEQGIMYYDMAIGLAHNRNVSSIVNKNQKLRKQISEKHYKQAMRNFNTDLDKTIELLSKSLYFYSGNIKAKQQLAKTNKIRENLRKIKNMKR